MIELSDDYRAEIGRYFKERRELLGIEQAIVAQHAGLTAGALSLIEHGRREPSVKALIRLARVLGIGVRLR